MPVNMLRGIVLILLFACSKGSAVFAAEGGVKVWEEKVVIPTYLMDAPDPNPQFYFGGTSQGAQQRIYPYPVYDNLTTTKADKTCKLIHVVRLAAGSLLVLKDATVPRSLPNLKLPGLNGLRRFLNLSWGPLLLRIRCAITGCRA